MRSLHYIVLLLCVLLQGCALALHGQTTGQATDTTAVAMPHRVALTGYVLDRDREPIEFASVRVEGTTIGTWSDLTGAYRLELTPTTDSVVVTYSSIGYQTVRQVYPQGILRDMHFNPMLGESATALSTVTVRGEARPPSMERITTQTLAMEASPTRSIESMVATYAGVTQHNELSTQYNVRGGSFDENLVYVNGIEVYRPLLVRSAEQEGLSFVNTDLVERVYFSAGAFDAHYGDRLSSVLDIQYKRPTKLEGAVSLGLMNNSLYVGGKHGRFTHVTGIRTRTTQLLLSKMETRGEYNPFYADAQTYLTYTFNDRWRIEGIGYYSWTQYRFRPQQRETTVGSLQNAKHFTVYFDGQERDRFSTLFGALTLHWRPSSQGAHRLDLSLYNSNERESYDITGAYYLQKEADPTTGSDKQELLATGVNHEHARNLLRYSVAALAYSGNQRLSETHRLMWGAELRGEQIADYISEWVKLDSAGYNLPRDPELIKMQSNLYSNVSLRSARASLYLQDEMQWQTPSGRYNLTAGVRGSFWSFNKKADFSPRLVASWRPKELSDLLVRAAGGLYYQSPFYKEIRIIEADAMGNQSVLLNDQVRSQGSAQALVGVDYNFLVADRKFRLTAEGYYKHLFRINPYYVDNVKQRYLGQNLGTGYIVGLDVKLFGEFVPDVDSWLTASLMRGRQTIEGYGEMPLPHVPDYNLSLFFQDYFPGYKRITLSLRGVLTGGLPQLNAAEGFGRPLFRGKPYKRVDIGMQYTLWDRETAQPGAWRWLQALSKVSVGVNVFNLFDMTNIGSYYWLSDAYRNQYAVPNYLTGRQYDASLIVRF